MGSVVAPRLASRHDSLSQAMLDASLDCVIAIGANGRVVEWNRAAERTFGYSRAEALGADLAELIIPPASRAMHRGAVAHAATGADNLVSQRVERTAMRACGEEFPVELTITRAEGPEAIFVGYLRDISERQRNRAELELEARRRTQMLEIGRQALGPAALPAIAARAAELARAELGAESCAILGSEIRGGPLKRIAASGEVAWPADAAGSGGPGTFDHPLVVDGEVAGAIQVFGSGAPPLGAADAGFVDALGQILVSALARQRAGRELEAAEQRYRGLVERLPIVSYLAEYGPDGRWLYVSPQIEQLLGYPPEEWLADRHLWWNRVHPEDRDRVEAEEERAVQNLTPLSIEYRMVARDGRVIWIRDEGAVGRRGENGWIQVEGVMLDVTDRRAAVEELRHRAYHDELTGLANRRRFTEELRCRRLRPGAAGSVAIVDVDDLKFVNDSLGHAAGDKLLRQVASALRAALVPGEFLARFGGDEFTLVLGASADAEIRERLGALLRSVRSPGSGPSARVSVGAVPFIAATESTDEDLIIAADIALHQAKERGGDRYGIFAGEERERLAWVGYVREAVDEDRLRLHSQPVFDLASGERIAGELLVRMLGEDGAVLSPAAFLPTAERFGLIRGIDRWVVERAIESAAAGGAVMVNLSARSISDPELTKEIERALSRTGTDPDRVVFEITETAAATASDDLRDFGTQIERLGCSLAIDDFGTGFGSLTYLKHLPVRYLKIDMEFVRGLTTSKADRAIVESITTIAGSLGMKTIGEGVEDASTLEALRICGVDYAQGYHLGRPAPLELPDRVTRP